MPNVYYQAISFDFLRSTPAFQALPPTETICLAGSPSYRYIRQDDSLWGRLHTGMLTSSRISAALGLHEEKAATRLKLSKQRTSHAHLLAAFHHLSEPPYIPDVNVHITPDAAYKHNEALRRASNSNTSYNHQGGQFGRGLPKTSSDELKNTLISEDVMLRKARGVGPQGLDAVRCAWGKAQEGASLLALGRAFPRSQVHEVGLCVLDAASLPLAVSGGIDTSQLPLIGASPDALIIHSEKKTTDELPTWMNHSDGVAELAEALSSAALSLPTIEYEHPDNNKGLWEVIEVKNTCPFMQLQMSKAPRRYALADRGPRQEVEPLWIPQLQLHMLCSGAASALLVSRSATRGIRIFRVMRSERYQHLILSMLHLLWVKHIVPGHPPPKDAFHDMKEHQELVKLTSDLAKGASVVAEIDEMPNLGDRRLFLD